MKTSTQRSIEIQRTPKGKPRPRDAELGFGKVFTDHMFLMDYDLGKGWHSQRIVPYGALNLDPAAAVLHYGQAMFEGLKAYRAVDGRVRLFRPDRHCRRMAEGAGRLCIPSVDPELMKEALLELVRVDQEWVPSSPGTALYIRPTLIATEPFLGVRPSHQYYFFIIMSPVGPYYAEGFKPVPIWVESRLTRAARGGLGGVKAGANYVASLLAAEQAKEKGYTQVLWLDAAEHRYIEEVGTMNLFVVLGDEVVTPPLQGSILAGITRDSVIKLLRDWGQKVSERDVAMEEVLAAERAGTLREIFGTGTAAVISPVGELGWGEGRILIDSGKDGGIAKRLYDTITALQYGQQPDPYGWIVEVC